MRGRILLILLASALVAMGQERTYKMGRWGITPGGYGLPVHAFSDIDIMATAVAKYASQL